MMQPLLRIPVVHADLTDVRAYDLEPNLAAMEECCVCTSCRAVLVKAKKPKFCFATVPVKPTPPYLRALSRLGLSLVARRLVMQTLFLLQSTTGPNGAQMAGKGWACAFATNNAVTMADALNLPRNPSEVIIQVDVHVRPPASAGAGGHDAGTARGDGGTGGGSAPPMAAATGVVNGAVALPEEDGGAADSQPDHDAPVDGTAPPRGQRRQRGEQPPRITTTFRPYARLDCAEAQTVRVALQRLRVENPLYRDIRIDEAMLRVVDQHNQDVLAAGGPLASTLLLQEVFLETAEQLANSPPESTTAVRDPDAPAVPGPGASVTADTAERVMASISAVTSANAVMDESGVLRVQLQPMRSSAIGAGRGASAAVPTAATTTTAAAPPSDDIAGTATDAAAAAAPVPAATVVGGAHEPAHDGVPDAVREADAIRCAYWADPHLLPKAFPALFPDGQGGPPMICTTTSDGVTEDEVQCNFSDYCKYLLQHYTRQFERCQPFLFFVQSLLKRRRIVGAVALAAARASARPNGARTINNLAARARGDLTRPGRAGGGGGGGGGGARGGGGGGAAAARNRRATEYNDAPMRPVTAGEIRRGWHTIRNMLAAYSSSLRGTGIAMNEARKDLMTMVSSGNTPVPVPSWFVTLSSADRCWPELFYMIDPELVDLDGTWHRDVSVAERERLLAENPVLAAKYFYIRFQAFVTHVLHGHTRPYGDIVDSWWRFEFQARGSVHAHGLLWSAGMARLHEELRNPVFQRRLAAALDKVLHARANPAQAMGVPEPTGPRPQPAMPAAATAPAAPPAASIAASTVMAPAVVAAVVDGAPVPVVASTTATTVELPPPAVGTSRRGRGRGRGVVGAAGQVVAPAAPIARLDCEVCASSTFCVHDTAYDDPLRNMGVFRHPSCSPAVARDMDSPETLFELLDLINGPMRHGRHTFTCFKKHQFTANGQPICRFKFPRDATVNAVHTEVVVAEGDALPNGDKLLDVRVLTPRASGVDQEINPYIPLALYLWRANMDQSLLANPFGAMVYVTSYITKSELADMVALSPEIVRVLRAIPADDADLLKREMRAVALSALGHREVSAQEVAWYLQQFPYVISSRVIVRLCLFEPWNRFKKLLTPEELALLPDDSTDVFARDGADDARGWLLLYQCRPRTDPARPNPLRAIVPATQRESQQSQQRSDDPPPPSVSVAASMHGASSEDPVSFMHVSAAGDVMQPGAVNARDDVMPTRLQSHTRVAASPLLSPQSQQLQSPSIELRPHVSDDVLNANSGESGGDDHDDGDGANRDTSDADSRRSRGSGSRSGSGGSHSESVERESSEEMNASASDEDGFYSDATNGLQERCVEQSIDWDGMSFGCFAAWFQEAQRGTARAYRTRWRLSLRAGDVEKFVTLRKKRAIVRVIPYERRASFEDNDFCYRVLMLHVAFRKESEILELIHAHGDSACTALRAVRDRLPGVVRRALDLQVLVTAVSEHRQLPQLGDDAVHNRVLDGNAAAEGAEAPQRGMYADDDDASSMDMAVLLGGAGADGPPAAGDQLTPPRLPGTAAGVRCVSMDRMALAYMFFGEQLAAHDQRAAMRRAEEHAVEPTSAAMQLGLDLSLSAAMLERALIGMEPAAWTTPLERALAQRVDQLNTLQRRAYDVVASRLQPPHLNNDDVVTANAVAGGDVLRMIVSGEGGTGKTFWIHAVAMLVKVLFHRERMLARAERQRQPQGVNGGMIDNHDDVYGLHAPVCLVAPTGCAAFLIGGRTLHSALKLPRNLQTAFPPNMGGTANAYGGLSADTLVKLRREWRGARVLIVDEMSMVSAETLLAVSLRLCLAMSNDAPFGGLHVIVCGDFYQLAPVGGTPLYSVLVRSRYADASDVTLRSAEMWRAFDTFAEFTEQRRTSDPHFGAAISLLRTGVPSNMTDAAWLTLVRQNLAQQQQQQLLLQQQQPSVVNGDGAPVVVPMQPPVPNIIAIPRNAAAALALLNEQAVVEGDDAILRYANQPGTTVLAGTWKLVAEYNRAHVAACVAIKGRVRIWALHHRSGSGAAKSGGGGRRNAQRGGRAAAVGGAMVDGQGRAGGGAAGYADSDEDEGDMVVDLDDEGRDMAHRIARVNVGAQGTTRENAMGLTERERRALLDYVREYGVSNAGGNQKFKKRYNSPLAALLELSVGCRVMLLSNLATPLGAVNGALGTVWGFVYGGATEPTEAERDADANAAAHAPPRQPLVLVQLDTFAGTSFVPNAPRVVPICAVPTSIKFGHKSFVRTQLPLCVAKASTIHKAQGQSLDSVCVDVRKFFKPGMAYVAISRARLFRCLWLLHDFLRVLPFQNVPVAIPMEYRRLRALMGPRGLASVVASAAGHAVVASRRVAAVTQATARRAMTVGAGNATDEQQPQPPPTPPTPATPPPLSSQQPLQRALPLRPPPPVDVPQASAVADMFHAPMDTIVPASMLRRQRCTVTTAAARTTTGDAGVDGNRAPRATANVSRQVSAARADSRRRDGRVAGMDVDGEQPAAQLRQAQQQHRPAATTPQMQRPPRSLPPQPQQHQMRASQHLSLADQRASEAQSLQRLMMRQQSAAPRAAPPSHAPLTAATSGGDEAAAWQPVGRPFQHRAARELGAAVALAEANIPGYSLANTEHSRLFVPFLCAVLDVRSPSIDTVQAAVHRALGASAWTYLVATYAAEFAVRRITQATVAWDRGRGPTSRDPYMGAAEQQRLLEPRTELLLDADGHPLPIHVTDPVYAQWHTVSPVFFAMLHVLPR